MKKLKYITLPLTTVALLSSSYLTTNPEHANRESSSMQHTGSISTSHRHAGAAGAVAATHIASHDQSSSGNSSGSSGSSGDSSGNSGSGQSNTPNNLPAPAAPTGPASNANEQYTAPANSSVPTTITPPAATPVIDALAATTIQTDADPKKTDNAKDAEMPIAPTDTPLALQQEQDHTADQTEILEKIEEINKKDEQNRNEIDESAMELIFNNFVRFKSFIVQNFAKDKIMSLCIEFINQIYPNEHQKFVSMQDSIPVSSSHSSTEAPAAAIEPHNAPNDDNAQENDITDQAATDEQNEDQYVYEYNQAEQPTESDQQEEESNNQ